MCTYTYVNSLALEKVYIIDCFFILLFQWLRIQSNIFVKFFVFSFKKIYLSRKYNIKRSLDKIKKACQFKKYKINKPDQMAVKSMLP